MPIFFRPKSLASKLLIFKPEYGIGDNIIWEQ